MTLLHPIWLLLSVPLAIAFIVWRPATRLLQVLRIAMFVLIVLAMCELAIAIRSRAGTVVVVADRSLSMPQQVDALQRELIRNLDSKRPTDSLLGVVSFGRGARIEVAPGSGRFESFSTPATEPQSEMQRGLETALSLIPPGSPGTILLLTDGRWTGRDPGAAMLAAADRGVPLDFRLMQRSTAGDLAIARIDPPPSVGAGEAFAIHATIESPVEQDATIALTRGDFTVASGKQHLVAGPNRIAFRDRARAGGVLSYTLQVSSESRDPQPENNQARFLVGVSGARPVLVVAGAPSSPFANLLNASGVVAEAEQQPAWTLEKLANHSAVVLENLPAERIGTDGMRTLASWVANAGGGLVLTGGRSSYAAGGYFRSPLEPILPVSMELRREHRKLRMSIVVAMDRSGSMAVAAGNGKTKMDLADLAAAQVLDLMSPQDELGVVAVDSSAHIIADLDPIEGRTDLRQRIMSVDSQGGGIFIFEALSTAARMLVTAHSETRHIILFADAADSEEPGEYRELLEKCAKANITVSVIGLGTEKDSDADLLRDIAKRGGGRIYFTEEATDLPRLFAQDTFIVARSAFVDELTTVKPTASLLSLIGRTFPDMPQVGGYNLCYLRDGASSDVLTVDEYHAPVLASWQAGLGRVATFMGEVAGEYSGPFGAWRDAGTFHASVVRWAAGGESLLPDNMFITQRIENGVARIDLQLDPERTTPGITAAPDVTTLSGRLGSQPVVTKARMTWNGPDQLSVEVPLSGDQTYISSVEVPNAGRITLPPARLPYPPEFEPAEEGAGARTLERLARATGGRERIDLDAVWSDLESRRQPLVVTRWLIALAALLLLIETLERRTRLVSSFALPRWDWKRERVHKVVAAPAARPAAKPQEPDIAPPPPAQPEPEPSTLVDALGRANARAKKKMR